MSVDVNNAVQQVIKATEQAIEEVEGAAIVVGEAYNPDRQVKSCIYDLREAMQIIEIQELARLKKAAT